MHPSLIALSCLVVCGLFSIGIESRHIKRSAVNEGRICSRSTPCGWEIYRPSDRRIEDFVHSPCGCPEESRCAKTVDDISISAYVYRCVPLGIEPHEWNYESLEN